MIRIAVDSASDYRLEELKAKNIDLIPISITVGSQVYTEGVNLDRNDFYRILKESDAFPQTSQPSPQLFLDLFQDVREKGDDLVYLSLSSALSGTYQGALMAREICGYDRIFIIDSLSATYNIKILADHAHTLRAAGISAEKIAETLEELKTRVKVLAALDTLEFLAKGGRLNRTVAAIGEFANLKPVITVTEEGQVAVIGKALGKNKAIQAVEKHLKDLNPDENFPLYSIYSFGTENCEKFEEKLAEDGIPVTERLQIGPTIGTHIGPGAFGVVFVAQPH